jgi:hypothetical protein
MGILQASSTQVDYVSAFWLVCFVHYLLRLKADGPGGPIKLRSLLAGASLGLALLTKETAYLYGFPFLLWHVVTAIKPSRWGAGPSIVIIALVAGGINAGHYARNLDMFGSPLGPTGEPQCADCKGTNDAVTGPIIVSNVVRNIGVHLGTQIGPLNDLIERGIYRLHALLGLDINDARSTWRGYTFQIWRPGYNEDLDGNPAHLLLIAVSLAMVLMSKELRASRELIHYALALMAAFLMFNLVVKWMAYNSRLHLALFVLWSPVIGIALSRIRNQQITHSIVMVLLLASLPWVLFNSMRPLLGERNIFNTERPLLYFIHRPALGSAFMDASQFVTRHHCSQIGLIRGRDDWEYPLWVLLQTNESTPVRIEDVGVTNESSVKSNREPFKSFNPCAVIAIHDDRITARVNAHTDIPPP